MVAYPSFDGTQLCAQSDPEGWFPESPFSIEGRMAKQICEQCEWKEPCLEYAVHHLVDGIWGGTTASERRKIRRMRNIRGIPLALSLIQPSQEALRARERRAARKEPQ